MWKVEIMEQFSQMEMKQDEVLSAYTYTKTGGCADIIAFPNTTKSLQSLILWANEKHIPITVLGNASNVIVKDSGISGIVVMMDHLTHVSITDGRVNVMSGMKLVDLAKEVRNHGLTGLEFACGIPGSVGGAVFMNAGAYGGEMKDVIESVDVLTREGIFKTYTNEEMAFAYRKSCVQETGDIILGTTLLLQQGNQQEIDAKMAELTQLRQEKQPLEYPSCGSVFKRPEGYFAGKLIQDAGLQGHRIGGVEVSKKHAGFMVNVDNGSATDYQELIAHVQKVVYDMFAVELEPEVKFIGE